MFFNNARVSSMNFHGKMSLTHCVTIRSTFFTCFTCYTRKHVFSGLWLSYAPFRRTISEPGSFSGAVGGFL